MSSRSPRGSISGVSSSAEVAADFEESLKDLQTNNRYEISNLTIIAKENTEHAQAISRALEKHIKTASPARKLPALFLLDSIVKNVGTPYTVYLGRNLYSTFMEAYTLVDGTTRRNMEGMLKTWKEPVPGSIDPRSVFPADTVRPIENALIKAKTAAIQHQRQPHVPFRGTATPPQHNGQFGTPPNQHIAQAHPGYGSQQPPNEVDGLKREIDSLVSRLQQTLASNPHNAGLSSQLGALRQLRALLDSRTMSPTELQQTKQQVAALSASVPPPSAMQSTPQPPLPVPTPQWQQPPMPPYSQPYQPPQPPAQTAPAPLPFPPGMPPNMPPGLPPNALNGLQALLANVPKPSTPQMRAAVPGLREATHSQLNTVQNNTTTPNANDPANLFATLAKAGLLGPNAAPPPAPPTSLAPPVDPTAALLKSLQGIIPTPQNSTPAQMPLQQPGSAAVPLSASSLKTFRPELVHALYDAQSNQCSTCGRRFLTTDEGREKKSRHLDWHFRMNQRIADPNTNRGHHRNWYVDEMDWIRHKEYDPSTTTATAADTEATAKAKKGPQDQFVRAPAGMTKNTCNICFEEMKSSYSEDLQDWIFANATVHNDKIVHATCLAEMTKPGPGAGGAGGSLAAALASFGGGQKERSATPDSLLRKRKAETAKTGGGARMRTE
ncbi:hypothetical protein M409DRAFT_65598 [Zasmidium cellare ATCC 36951]|uniref:CID domain-containing protein n=1 Tax=Zasmidium cellare ATCC 36951 TaxID=1080233 RepID=A0A6A6CLP1_ZASCE|nr:uncharacterized protein M409DRAFT_65598 [Zasmidium cellare ATCC 36951]KAF2168055.1 hypothetical protein M409DRAFT_65598 [Zasmidium cellare ATCC 36951]